VRLRPGEGGHGGLPGSATGGLLALYQACTHLGCRLPWRPDFDFEGEQGWFRCPCHGATYTKAGVRVFGPAPRDMDQRPLRIDRDGTAVIDIATVVRGQCRPGGC